MKIIKIVGVLIVLLLMTAAVFLWYMGFFSTLQVNEQEMGPYTYVFERFIGPYWETEQIFKKVEHSLKAEGIASDKAIGIYYDNPAVVLKDKLRSDCGLVLEDKDLPRVPDLKKKYSVATIAKKMCIVVEFPMKNKLSYMFGPMRAYPALLKYMQDKGYKMAVPFELYENDKIFFVMEIVKSN
jgi:hypothetical protein